jgi:hypothetical protein
MSISNATPQVGTTRQEELPALDAWLTLHAAAMLIATLVAAALRSAAPIALAGAISFGLWGFRSRRALARLRPYGGYANHLTALRLAAVLCAAALLTDISREWLLVIFGANVLLDVADGYAAQRANQTSELGTMFDREADAIFVLVAYTYFFCVTGVGAWILVPGLLPYLYHLCARAVHETPTRLRKQRLFSFAVSFWRLYRSEHSLS